MEHFRSWGLATALRRRRLMPDGYPIGEILAYGNLMGDYWHAPAGREVVREYYLEANERLPQYCMEDVLRERLNGLPDVDFLCGWTLTDVVRQADPVMLRVTHPHTGDQVLSAKYAVGCDGARSLMRELAGIRCASADYEQRMVLAVFRSRSLHDLLKRFPQRSTYRVMHPDLHGYWKFFGRIDVGESWFFHAPVPPGSDASGFDIEKVIDDAVGHHVDCSFDYVGFWDLRIAIAEQFCRGRIFIAGDAAHSHPPYGGFGLNNGLEDVVNLGWKLDATLRGWGGGRLLDSFDLERRPVFEDLAEHFIDARIREENEFLQAYNPAQGAERFAAAWASRKSDLSRRVERYEPNYEGSPVVMGSSGSTSARGTHRHEARAGHHLSPQRLSDGGSIFEALGNGMTLLAFGLDECKVEPLVEAARERGIPLKVVRDDFREGRRRYGARFVLVRPDQFVAWCGDAVADPREVIAGVTGHA